ncbi:MAG: SPFH domain-containing protein [Ruminococcaceae bacterium]|nr:SPFH domain-containing protein [Oscillospiraceae bacterium]
MYVKFSPNLYVIRYRNGKVVKEGTGLSFFYLEKYTSAVAVPITNNDTDFIFEETTKDFQSVTVQGQLTYRIADCKKVANALDFSVNMKTKTHVAPPMPKLSKRMINIAEVFIKSRIGELGLTEAMRSSRELAAQVYEELRESEELKALGIEICGFSVLKVSANPETARALEAKAREEILKRADDALYERRNGSIEQERKIKENELATELSVEQKKKAIRESEIATKKMILERENELARMKTESQNELERIRLENERVLEEKKKEIATLRLENSKKDAEADAYRIAAVMDAYAKLSPEVLVALATMNMDPGALIAEAFNKLAGNADKIGQLNITPDLLETVMRKKA